MRFFASCLCLAISMLPSTLRAEPEKKEADPGQDAAGEAAKPEDDRAVLDKSAHEAMRRKDYRKAAEIWNHLRETDPQDWRVRPWLVCVHQAAGDIAARDREIAGLYALRKAGTVPELGKTDRYVRDTFEVDGMTAYVFEFFELKGEFAPVWKFRFRKDGEDIPYMFLLESDETDTTSARQLGEIGPDERVYSLDRYEMNGNETIYQMFKKKPDYDELKSIVIDVVKGVKDPVGSLKVGK